MLTSREKHVKQEISLGPDHMWDVGPWVTYRDN